MHAPQRWSASPDVRKGLPQIVQSGCPIRTIRSRHASQIWRRSEEINPPHVTQTGGKTSSSSETSGRTLSEPTAARDSRDPMNEKGRHEAACKGSIIRLKIVNPNSPLVLFGEHHDDFTRGGIEDLLFDIGISERYGGGFSESPRYFAFRQVL